MLAKRVMERGAIVLRKLEVSRPWFRTRHTEFVEPRCEHTRYRQAAHGLDQESCLHGNWSLLSISRRTYTVREIQLKHRNKTPISGAVANYSGVIVMHSITAASSPRNEVTITSTRPREVQSARASSPIGPRVMPPCAHPVAHESG